MQLGVTCALQSQSAHLVPACCMLCFLLVKACHQHCPWRCVSGCTLVSDKFMLASCTSNCCLTVMYNSCGHVYNVPAFGSCQCAEQYVFIRLQAAAVHCIGLVSCVSGSCVSFLFGKHALGMQKGTLCAAHGEAQQGTSAGHALGHPGMCRSSSCRSVFRQAGMAHV